MEEQGVVTETVPVTSEKEKGAELRRRRIEDIGHLDEIHTVHRHEQEEPGDVCARSL